MRWRFREWGQARSMAKRLVPVCACLCVKIYARRQVRTRTGRWEGYPWWKVVLRKCGKEYEVSVRNWSVVEGR